MMSDISVNSIKELMQSHPIALGGAVTATALGGVYVVYSMIKNRNAANEIAKKAAAVEAKAKAAVTLNDLHVKTVNTKLGVLGVTEWEFPNLKKPKVSKAETHPPVLAKETQVQCDKAVKMIEKALKTGGAPNLILSGPAGVGKTISLEEICRKAGAGFIRIPSGSMEHHLKIGTHITAFHEVLKAAKLCDRTVYIIMDDSEEVLGTRDIEAPKKNDGDDVKAPWLIEQEKFSHILSKRRIAFVNAILEESGKAIRQVAFGVTTNREFVIDPAFKTRALVIQIGAPGQQERKQIIANLLQEIFYNDLDMWKFFDKGRLEKMAIATEGFTGRNLLKMVQDIYVCVQLQNGDITQEIIDGSIIAVKQSVDNNKPKKEEVSATSILIEKTSAFINEASDKTVVFIGEASVKIQKVASSLYTEAVNAIAKFSAKKA